MVQKGEEVIITNDRNREKLAVILPYHKYHPKKERNLGVLKGKATFKLKDDFKITDEELLSL